MQASFWKTGTIFPFISCIMITIVQSLRLITPKLFPTEKEYKKLNDVIEFFFEQHIELHKLWHEFEKGEITEPVARQRYFKLLAKEKNILHTVNEVLSDNNKRRIRRAEKATRKSLNLK